MKLAVKSLLCLGASLGTSAFAVVPAMALTPLTMPTIGGTNPGDFALRCSDGMGLVSDCMGGETLEDVLMGMPGAPGGHVELANSSEQPGFDFNLFTSLEGFLGDKPFFARSLTADDWFSNDNALTKQFLGDALAAYPGIVLPPGVTFDQLVQGFIASGGPQRFSDPNITYVFKDDNEKLTVGLAGVYNASDLLAGAFPGAMIPDVVQVSELVYVEFHGQSKYLYSFTAGNAEQSGMGGSTGCVGGAPPDINDPLAKCSYSGDYTPMLQKVPEPSSLLGLLAIGGGLLAAKRSSKKA